jgi:hypothetical protein
MDEEMRSALKSIFEKLEQIHAKLVWVDWSLDILRAQPEQEKLQLAFEKTAALTVREVRSWKKGGWKILIKEDIDNPLPYRCISYRHDHLDEEISFLEIFRRAHGFRHLSHKEQERKLEKINLAAQKTNQETKTELEEAEQWIPYEFLVGEEESSDEDAAPIKEADRAARELISEASQRASRRGADL